MTKTANSPSQGIRKLAPLRSYVARHKFATVVTVLLFILIIAVGGRKYYVYVHHFSKQDFEMVAAMGETVLKNSGGKDIQQSRICGYDHIGELFPKIQLSCQVAMVSYLAYKGDIQAATTAHTLEREAQKYGRLNTLSAGMDFFTKPSDNDLTVYVDLTRPYPKTRCSFEIATGRFAKNMGYMLPKKNEDNLLALVFICSEASRAEYYPVTYR